jgi:hypothetical protein
MVEFCEFRLVVESEIKFSCSLTLQTLYAEHVANNLSLNETGRTIFSGWIMGIVTTLRAGRYDLRIPAGARDFTVLQYAQTCLRSTKFATDLP